MLFEPYLAFGVTLRGKGVLLREMDGCIGFRRSKTYKKYLSFVVVWARAFDIVSVDRMFKDLVRMRAKG